MEQTAIHLCKIFKKILIWVLPNMPLQQSSIFSLKNKKKERKKEKRPTIEVIFPFQLNVSFEVPPILIPVASVSILTITQRLLHLLQSYFLEYKIFFHLQIFFLMYICMSFFRHWDPFLKACYCAVWRVLQRLQNTVTQTTVRFKLNMSTS